jgi:hypothetical protein
MLKALAPLAPSRPAPAGQLSAAIGVARVMCILGIVYVHAWTGLGGGDLARLDGTPQGMLRWVLMELLGRSAVPLLSMISGWLVASSVARQPWGAFMGGKARTVLAPMVLWNALAIVLVSGAACAGLIQGPVPTTWRWVVEELLCLTRPNDINVQMPFLRDLFVCMALAPLLVRLPAWSLGLIVAVSLAWAISGFHAVLLLRPAIMLFFVLGMLVRRGDRAARLASRPLVLAAIPYAALALVKVWLEAGGVGAAPPLMATVDMLTRFATALFFWSLAGRLAASRAAPAPALLRVEPYAFLMFCAHLIMLWLGGPLIGRLTGPLGSPLYPVFLLVQPLLALGATLLLGGLLRRASPPAASLLSGGRLR